MSGMLWGPLRFTIDQGKGGDGKVHMDKISTHTDRETYQPKCALSKLHPSCKACQSIASGKQKNKKQKTLFALPG